MQTDTTHATRGPSLWWSAPLLIGTLLVLLFFRSFSTGMTLFSNDGPLGVISTASGHLPEGFLGVWQDQNWVGTASPAATPDITQTLGLLFRTAVPFSKFYTPTSLLLLGLAAWFCFRQHGFDPAVSLLGGVAAALNSNLLSYACWGLPSRALAVACCFVAIGLLTGRGRWNWIRVVLAGFAVGINVMEAADSGALLSLYVAGAVCWREWASNAGTVGARILRGGLTAALLAVAAAWIAFSGIHTLVTTSIQGVAVLQDEQRPEQRWEFATNGSLPKTEVLRFIIPGIFGYRMDTPDGGEYWGAVGPDGDPAHRSSGGGEYAGVLVMLGAAWAVARSLRAGPSPFSDTERRMVWFWAIAAAVSVLLAFGRHAPFFQLIFPLPFFRTMRMPMKFLHGFHLCVLLLFGYGLQALAREHLARPTARLRTWGELVRSWWRANSTPLGERRFVIGLAITLAASLLGTLVYTSYRPNLIRHLQSLVIDGESTFNHSVVEILIFAGFLAAGASVWVLILAGAFNGARARVAWWILGGLLATDLYRASTPWIIHYDYQRRYQTNAVIDFLRAKPQESRVAFRLPNTRQLLISPNDGVMWKVHNLWLENHFPYNNIQTVDIIQAPRMPALDEAYLGNFLPGTNGHIFGRFWQLTATRYVMADRAYEAQLNSAVAMPGTAFVPRLTFELGLKPDAQTNHLQVDDFDAVVDPRGHYALLEYTGALPRVKLYTRWEIPTNDVAALARLRDFSFDPAATVLLDSDPGIRPSAQDPAGEATIEDYQPKHSRVKVRAATDAVLLVNDRWHKDWEATVDGKPTVLLRANHLMRGVAVPAGEHNVEFRFQTDTRPLYISLSAIVVGIGLVGFLAVRRQAAPQKTGPVGRQ